MRTARHGDDRLRRELLRRAPAPVGLSRCPRSPATNSTHTAAAGACVLIGSDEPTDALGRFGDAALDQSGERTPDGALGFRDGTMNPRRPLDLDRHVWVTDARPDRDARRHLPRRPRHRGQPRPGTPSTTPSRSASSAATSTPARRSAARGCSRSRDLERLPEDAHIRQASPRTSGVTILRRGYDTPHGLLFLAFMKDPRRQFVPLQQRLSAHDALHPHTTARGSAVFAVPPEKPVVVRSMIVSLHVTHFSDPGCPGPGRPPPPSLLSSGAMATSSNGATS